MEGDGSRSNISIDTVALAAEPNSQELRSLEHLVSWSPSEPPPRLEPGTRLAGSFEILEPLGTGGMGIVYRARDLRLDRDVAVKLHRPMAHATERLQREATSMAQLSHPNVATVHEVGHHEGMLFIAMELVDGPTARLWAAEDRTSSEVIELYHRAGQGLAAAHDAGLVHRDFKPENVLVGRGDVPRVVDFGLARPLQSLTVTREDAASPDPEEHVVTRPGAIAGTPAYMAPEQLAGEDVDARTDQYAFAVSLFEALYGKRPPHLSAGPLVLPTQPRIPPRARHALQTALALDPNDRFPSMHELLVWLGPDPRAARRRTIVVASGAAIGAATMVIVASNLDLDDTAERCAEQAARASLAWTDHRVDVQQAFAQTEQTWAQPTFDAMAERLDTHEDRLRGEWASACEARSHEAMPPDELDHLDECLHRVGERTDAMVDVLIAADAPIAAKALQAVLELPPPSRCRDPALASVGSIASSEAQSLYATAIAHYHLGLDGEARRLALHARDASGEREEDLAAPLLLLDAMTGETQGRFDEAESAYEQAFFTARRRGGWATASEAAARIVGVITNDPTRWDEAALWGKLAVSEARQGGRGGVIEAHAHSRAAAVDMLHGRYDEALAQYELAASMLTGDDASPLDRALTELGIGNASDKLGRHTVALEHHHGALEAIESVLGPDHPSLLPILTGIALTDVSLGRGESAVIMMERALKIVRSSHGPTHPQTGRILLDLGVAYAAVARFEETIPLYEEALRIIAATHGPNHYTAAHVHSSLSVALGETGEPDAALEQIREAVRISEHALGPDHPETARFLTNLAGALWRTDAQAALEPAQRAVSILRRDAPASDDLSTAEVICGEVYTMLERWDDAIEVLRPALARYEAHGIEGLFLAKARYNLGLAVMQTGEFEEGARLVEAGAQAYEALGGRHVEFAASLREWITAVRPPR